jgi:GntR family transcriptional regulator/MocR family aminotransferase
VQVILEVDQSKGSTLQQQVFQQIRGHILEGRLRSGDPVPASRELSQQLGVSRNTVVIAYDRLLSEGYLESKASVGTFVSSALPEKAMNTTSQPIALLPDETTTSVNVLAEEPKVNHSVVSPNKGASQSDYWVGRSDPKTFPTKEWRRILDLKVRYANTQISQYSDPQGVLAFRQAISDHLGPARGVSAKPEEIVCTNGSQGALALIARAFSKRFKTLVHEDPCYSGAISVFGNSGYKLLGVPVDNDGLVVERLPKTRNALIYVTPSHQYPTGVTLSLKRRFELLEWAEKTDSVILEDDYNGDFRYEGAPLTALHGLDRRGSVIYIGTFSKSFGPSLRLGYLACERQLAATLGRWQGILSNGLPWLEQAAMAEFVSNGGFRRHLRRIRTIYMDRRNVLMDALHSAFPNAELHGLRGGMHISARLPDVDVKAAQSALSNLGIGVYRVQDCGAYCSRSLKGFDDVLIFGYAAVGENEIERTVSALADFAEGRLR